VIGRCGGEKMSGVVVLCVKVEKHGIEGNCDVVRMATV
jgi:hypothetical protein